MAEGQGLLDGLDRQIVDRQIERHLRALEVEQARATEHFAPGLFYAYRHHPIGYDVADDGLCYQALTVWALQRCLPLLPAAYQARVQQICSAVMQHYPLYRSVPGLQTYNFWQTRPRPRFFPNGHIGHRDEFFRPPDDSDDTAFVYITAPQAAEHRRWLKEEKYPKHANLSDGRRITATLKQWRDLPAYTTFFTEKMPHGYDVVVMANIMHWVFGQGFALNKHDMATLQILRETMEQGLYLSRPYQISPYYPYPANILDCIGRLVADNDNEYTAALRPFIIEGAKSLLVTKLSPVPRIKMKSLLLRLGEAVEPEAEDTLLAAQQDVDFSYFAFPLATEYGLAFAQWLAPSSLLRIRFCCPAFNIAASLEYQLLASRQPSL